LEHGILETGSTLKVRRKHIRLKYGDEFIEWFDEWAKEEAYDWCKFIEVYEGFINSTGTERKFFSAKRFSMGIKESAEMILEKPSDLEKDRSTEPGRPLRIKLKKRE
jgi:hypothetical protein